MVKANSNVQTSSTTELLIKRKGPGRPSKKDTVKRKVMEEKKENHNNNNNIESRRTMKRLKSFDKENDELYYVNRVGDQVVVYKSDQNQYYYGRIVDVNPTCVLIHFEGFTADHADWVPFHSIHPNGNTIGIYGPHGEESISSWEDYKGFYYSSQGIRARQHTGLVDDRRMLLHSCPCHSVETIHPERPDRIISIFQALHSQRLLRYFKRIRAREVTSNELLRVHTFAHVRNYYPLYDKKHFRPIKITSIAALLNYSPPNSPVLLSRQQPSIHNMCIEEEDEENHIKLEKQHIKEEEGEQCHTKKEEQQCQSFHSNVAPPDLVYKMTCGELGIAIDTTYNELHSSTSARVAAGALIELADKVVQGELTNGFALIRPPGHHAEDDVVMGYCYYNNVAVAVTSTLEKYPTIIKKILIIDWDIHHGNGTQKIFYDNPNVLYISIHRWESGKFYPFTGAPDECGQYEGLGYNVNIALNESKEKPKPMGDTEFVAAFHHILIPIARQFHPDMIFVSAGFDAAEGHAENLGGYNVTPRGFGLLTKIVRDLAQELCEGRLVLSLEGGYELQPLANSASESISQLLEDEEDEDYYAHSLNGIKPNLGAIDSFRNVVNIQKAYWNLPSKIVCPDFRFQLPNEWRALDSISNRPKRDKRTVIKNPIVVDGY
ncbi:Arginase/deacetylase [Backusella circina FSU 941]|nr:Arginase/deacetylase [Backusella circina FSU 941]